MNTLAGLVDTDSGPFSSPNEAITSPQDGLTANHRLLAKSTKNHVQKCDP